MVELQYLESKRRYTGKEGTQWPHSQRSGMGLEKAKMVRRGIRSMVLWGSHLPGRWLPAIVFVAEEKHGGRGGWDELALRKGLIFLKQTLALALT